MNRLAPLATSEWSGLLDCFLSDQVAIADIQKRCDRDPLFRVWLYGALKRRARASKDGR